jgi:hypothetical protein
MVLYFCVHGNPMGTWQRRRHTSAPAKAAPGLQGVVRAAESASEDVSDLRQTETR